MVNGRIPFQLTVLVLIPLTTYFGDEIVANASSKFTLVYKCIVDSSTHFLIALLCFVFALGFNGLCKEEIAAFAFACGTFSSLIDVDHFIAAKSFELKEAASLKTRPAFHCTTLFFLPGAAILFISVHKKQKSLFLFGWVVIIASLTHHMRDGYRRGLWMCPFPATTNYTYATYILLLMVFTLISKVIASFLKTNILPKKRPYEKIILLV